MQMQKKKKKFQKFCKHMEFQINLKIRKITYRSFKALWVVSGQGHGIMEHWRKVC